MTERSDGKISAGAAKYLMQVFGATLEQAVNNSTLIECLRENVEDGFLEFDLEIINAIYHIREATSDRI